jgi:hypothetical protein
MKRKQSSIQDRMGLLQVMMMESECPCSPISPHQLLHHLLYTLCCLIVKVGFTAPMPAACFALY